MSIVKKLARTTLGALPAPAGVSIHYFLHQKRLPKIKSPDRFSEKVIRRKLRDRNPAMPVLADKIEAKKFVADALGPEFVIPTIWHGSSLPPRLERDWPSPFVIKAAHGSGSNHFVFSDAPPDWVAIEEKCTAWLRTQHARWAGEWLYTQIPPRLLVEPYLSDTDTLPIDYKCFVFGGKVHYIQVDTGRSTNHRRTFFSPDWKRQEFSMGYPLDEGEIPPPSSLAEIIKAAEALGAEWPFVRIDFYDIHGKPKFGEFTFYPDSGVAVFNPDKYDEILGSLWP